MRSKLSSAITALVVLFLLSSIACSSGGGGSDDSSDSPDSGGNGDSDSGGNAGGGTSRTLTVATYNVGLLPFFVELTDERVAPLQAALPEFSADVLCVQEAWRPQDRAALIGALQGDRPNIFEPPARQKFASQVPVCTFGDLEPVAGCLLQACLFSDRGFTECAVAECRSTLNVLAAENPECAGALFAQAGRSSSDITAIQDELLGSSSPAGLFAFDGSTGLFLASRYELSNRQVVDFFDESTTSHRAALLATVTVDGVAHQVGCTHLTSNLDGLVPYTGSLSSWQNEARTQADLLLAAVDSRSASQPTVLLGDFNCGIPNSQTGVAGDFQENCERIIASGYSDPAGEELGCSFCTANTLNSSNPEIAGTRNLLLDHVFVRNLFADPLSVELSLQQLVSAGGTQSNLSDHYAVRVAIPVAPAN